MPTVSSMPFLKPHFHSNGASAAVAYKLYSYDSTTEDALPLYKDPAGSVEYPNPLVLNSRGEPDGMGLYLDNEKTYKLILKTAEDVEVWTVNAVQGVTGGGSTSVVTLPAHTAYANSGDSANVAAPVEIVSSITSETDDDLIASVGSVKEQVTNLQSDINTLSENLTCRVDGTPDQIVSTESVDEESGFKVFTESLSPTFVTRVTNIESSLQTKESLQYTGFRTNSGSGPFFVKIASASFQSGYGSMDLTCGVGGSSTAYGEFSVKVIRAINGTSMYAQWNSLFNRASTFQLEEIRCFYVGPNDIQLWAKTPSPFTQSSISFEPLINVRYGSSGVATGRAFSFQKVGTTGSYPSTYVNYCLAKSVDCLSASDQRRTEVTSDDASVEVTKTEVYDGKGYTNTFDLSVLSTPPALSFVDIDSTDSPYSAPETVDEIVVSTATADVVVTLPVTSLKRFYIKWLLGTHNLTVNVADSGMIDGVTSFVFNTKFSVGTSISFVCKESGDWIANGTITDGSSGSGEVAHIATGDSLGAKDIIQLQAGSSTQWSAHGAMCSTIGAITPQMTSEMGFIATQVVSGNYIIAAYKVETNLAHTLICSTGVTAFPSLAGWINTPVLNHVKAIAANDRVYLVVLTDSNGVAMAGASCTAFNIQPYVAGIKTNMGVLTEAPATLTFDSETNTRPFIYMTK